MLITERICLLSSECLLTNTCHALLGWQVSRGETPGAIISMTHSGPSSPRVAGPPETASVCPDSIDRCALASCAPCVRRGRPRPVGARDSRPCSTWRGHSNRHHCVGSACIHLSRDSADCRGFSRGKSGLFYLPFGCDSASRRET
jgi:hypothetical protein